MKRDLIVWDVDQEIAIACADAAIAVHDLRVFMIERCCCDIVREGAAVAGCFVCLSWCLGVGHGVRLVLIGTFDEVTIKVRANGRYLQDFVQSLYFSQSCCLILALLLRSQCAWGPILRSIVDALH